jgi:flagellar protein FlaG
MNHATFNVVRSAAPPAVDPGQRKSVAPLDASNAGANANQTDAAASKEQVSAAVARLNKLMASSSRELQFQVDDESGRVIVRVRDAASGEIIRQMPSEEALRMARALQAQIEQASNSTARNLQGNAPVLLDLTV